HNAEGVVVKVLAPHYTRLAGRPILQRQRDVDEGGSSKATKQYGKFGVIGHYKSTCTCLIAEQIAKRGGG
ncbi:hypothetical protein MKX01_029502, partial [Papaver californicum]